MCRKLLVMVAFLCAVLTTTSDATAAGLDGAWALQVQPAQDTDPNAKQFREDVLFLDGTFSAAASAMYGFAPATYSLENAAFSVTLTSSKHGTQVWSGTTHTRQLSGTLVWTKPDGRVLRYHFSGEPIYAAVEDAVADD